MSWNLLSPVLTPGPLSGFRSTSLYKTSYPSEATDPSIFVTFNKSRLCYSSFFVSTSTGVSSNVSNWDTIPPKLTYFLFVIKCIYPIPVWRTPGLLGQVLKTRTSFNPSFVTERNQSSMCPYRDLAQFDSVRHFTECCLLLNLLSIWPPFLSVFRHCCYAGTSRPSVWPHRWHMSLTPC